MVLEFPGTRITLVLHLRGAQINWAQFGAHKFNSTGDWVDFKDNCSGIHSNLKVY